MKLILALLCLVLTGGCASTVPNSTGPITVTINGEVQNPGTYSFSQGVSLGVALQRAGGFAAFPWLKSIEIIHRDGVIAHCDYRKNGDRFMLSDGDQVVVHRYMW